MLVVGAPGRAEQGEPAKLFRHMVHAKGAVFGHTGGTQRMALTPIFHSRRSAAMELDEIEAEVFLLLNQMENQPEDRYGLYLKLQEKLRQMQAFGMTPPQDLVALVEELDAEFTEEAHSSDIRGASPNGG
jgi:hypothetical protein